MWVREKLSETHCIWIPCFRFCAHLKISCVWYKNLTAPYFLNEILWYLSSHSFSFSLLRFVLYFSALCDEVNHGKKLLHAALSALQKLLVTGTAGNSSTAQSEDMEEAKPTLLWSALYIQDLSLVCFASVFPCRKFSFMVLKCTCIVGVHLFFMFFLALLFSPFFYKGILHHGYKAAVFPWCNSQKALCSHYFDL